MPISKLGAEDRLTWRYTKDGVFSMRSAYYVDLTKKRRAKGELSTEMEQDDRWKYIQGMKVPRVVKMFLWKTGNNILLSRKNLSNRELHTTLTTQFVRIWRRQLLMYCGIASQK